MIMKKDFAASDYARQAKQTVAARQGHVDRTSVCFPVRILEAGTGIEPVYSDLQSGA
jgi:hypothetical protein